ncbi:proline iminopeptidase-family hydrolase [Lactobacillaceae bacterium 24-114]
MQVKELFIPFGKYQTYCRIVGKASDKAPLLFLHGGPGSTHNYFELLDELAGKTNRQFIMYDQLGCGRSSIPDDHPELYNAKTWIAELKNLRQYLRLEEVHLLGQSWGGMLAIIYLCDYHPTGIKSLILSSTLASADLWQKELHRLIKYLPENEQEAIQQAEATNNFTTPEYQAANCYFMELHANGPDDEQTPEPLRRPKKGGKQAYLTAWGPNEYNPLGNLKDYEYTSRLKEICQPVLIISGTDDLCTPLDAKNMADNLPNALWELVPNARHMVFADQPKLYQKILTEWLSNKD